ncbi:Calmodulin-binding domain-containing protein [Caenorhabditis elegans]|uniref:Calmodulin-binding domain-containing protein n=1 Tax=Caenorhabditis elegans TaxID=6239 RepID=G5EDG3_CAEEL|nr:Calmodulin-binding domain-containing protein [Caenorhabditis elegans]CAD54123.1 Calmodulin-binding domain-containing protein [Caenorhabditis elegans]|eukprot:NP_872182.1 KCNN (potassium K ChaNNel, calcium activated)-Like [Caenorhabditis elegans]
MRVRASSYCQMDDRIPFLTPQLNSHSHSRLSAETEATSGNTLSSSLSTIPITGQKFATPPNRVLVKGHTVSTCSPRFGSTSIPAPLDRRQGRSCEFHTSDDDRHDRYDNPIAQVSSDILRVSGYTQQFRSLLTARFSPRRESTPDVTVEAPEDENKNDDRYVNGGVRFDNDVIEEGTASGAASGGVGTPKKIAGFRRRQSGYGIAISSDSTAKMRCRLRKQLFIRRNKVCDISLFLAVLGLLLVIIDSELTALSSSTGITKDSPISIILRSACVVSTFFLICCLINYHAIEVKIALIDSGADDWRVAFSTDRFIKMLIEVCVCMICPFPEIFSDGLMKMPYINADTRQVKMRDVPIDVLLSVPMFLRSYLVCRFMVLHSKQFQDAATRSIAALNRISMDFRFVIKTMMADHPLRVLIVFTLSYWMCMSWMFTQCERYDGQLEVEHYYLNSMWFIMVTFMSIGYGDIVPNTYCGRCLSITTGIVGAGVSSALIAIISRKLELSRAEKHVNNFMADSKLTNQRKNAAASVLQETWFIHKYKKALHKGDDLRLRHHQRRFLHSINEFRRIKWDQRKLQEKGNSLLDVGKLHSDMHETLWEMHRTQDHFISQIDVLTQKIMELQMTLNTRPPCCAPPTSSSNDAYFSTSTQLGTVLPTVIPTIPLPPTQSPMLHASQSHREPLQVTTTTTTSSDGLPRISVGSTSSTATSASSGNGSLPQCTVDQLSNCPTGGIYATVTTPLISNFEEV